MLWAEIPKPAHKKAKAQKSWKTLEVGRELSLLERWFNGRDWFETGEVFRVTKVTNLGVTLGHKSGYTYACWSREWKGFFKKVVKRKKKTPKSVGPA